MDSFSRTMHSWSSRAVISRLYIASTQKESETIPCGSLPLIPFIVPTASGSSPRPPAVMAHLPAWLLHLRRDGLGQVAADGVSVLDRHPSI
jgi:hypothetical protein